MFVCVIVAHCFGSPPGKGQSYLQHICEMESDFPAEV